jgi:hypothetical protein
MSNLSIYPLKNVPMLHFLNLNKHIVLTDYSSPNSYLPVNRTNHPHVNMSIPTPKPRKRRLSLSEIDESPAIDAAIDIFQKSQSSIMVSLPSTGCFDTMVQRVEETMALVDKRGISLAHKAKRRRTIAERLSERKHAVESKYLLVSRPVLWR